MAGGLFPGYPFSLNVKCIVFTAILAGGYWYLPPKNFWVLAFLIWFPYIALAWYDYMYKCQDKLKPTLVPFGRYIWLPFKPAEYKAQMTPELETSMRNLDHIILWSALAAVTAYFLVKK
jgi:hypothetical protein